MAHAPLSWPTLPTNGFHTTEKCHPQGFSWPEHRWVSYGGIHIEAPALRGSQARKTSRGGYENSVLRDGDAAGEIKFRRQSLSRTTVDFAGRATNLGLRFDCTPAARTAPKGCTNESAESSLADVADNGDPTSSGVELDHKDVRVLAEYKTAYNFVRVLDVARSANHELAGARVLQLDRPGNVHSIYHKHRLLTGSYYDVMAALPAVVPEGPVGILGLGAGTVAHLIRRFWPGLDVHGWELDPGVVQAARKYFDLMDLELKMRIGGDKGPLPKIRVRVRRRNGSYGPWEEESEEVRLGLFRGTEPDGADGGTLTVHVGDALRPDAAVDGGFAGLVVDLFVDGAVIPQLQTANAWRAIRGKLRPGGRIIVNCGGTCVEAQTGADGGETMRRTVAALAEVFPGELSVMRLSGEGDNCVALTGPPPDFRTWRDALPDCLRPCMESWRVHSQSP